MKLCGVRPCQYVAYTFNALYVVFGLVILGIGLWAKFSISDMEEIMSDRIVHNAAILMIAAGAVVVCLASIGCYGIYAKHTTLVFLYCIAIFVVFIMELSAGLYAYTRRKEIRQRLAEGVRLTVATGYGGRGRSAESATFAMDWIQKSVKCCGSDSPNDWTTSHWYMAHKGKQFDLLVPLSCCASTTNTAACNKGDTISGLIIQKKIYSNGCFAPAQKYVKKYYSIVGKVGITIAFIQLLGIVIFYVLAKLIKSELKDGHPGDADAAYSTSQAFLSHPTPFPGDAAAGTSSLASSQPHIVMFAPGHSPGQAVSMLRKTSKSHLK